MKKIQVTAEKALTCSLQLRMKPLTWETLFLVCPTHAMHEITIDHTSRFTRTSLVLVYFLVFHYILVFTVHFSCYVLSTFLLAISLLCSSSLPCSPAPSKSINSATNTNRLRDRIQETGRRSMEHEKHEEELDLATVDLEEEGFVEELVAACRDPGVFRLVNHGVPGELSARLFGLARDLLDPESKKAQPGYFWGTPALSLRVKELNWVEGFHVAAADHSSGDAKDGDAYSLFRKATAEYVVHMARIARKLFDALAGELGLEAEKYLAEQEGIFRAYRYPACPSGRYMGMEAHTDSSVLSILNQDLVGGLEVAQPNRDGEGERWCGVRPVEGTLVVNLGDMMQAMSGDEYRSVRHRVVARPDEERMSLCYFTFPQEEAVIRSGNKYRAFSYREFREKVQADIKATGAKVGLPRFRLRIAD